MADYEELMQDLKNGVKRIKDMTCALESGDLTALSRQLQNIIVYSAELSKIIDDCEVCQRRAEALQAVEDLVKAGFVFNSIEIDGMRFRVGDNREVELFDDPFEGKILV